jgi:hypothetical protein
MAWETRGNRSYFYRKERINGKVKSVYVGSDAAAVLIAERAKAERIKKEAKKLETDTQRGELEALDRQINALSEFNQNLVDALFLISGFHQHKRQWRKKRK